MFDEHKKFLTKISFYFEKTHIGTMLYNVSYAIS